MKSVCGAGRMLPHSGNGCAQSGTNGPGSLSSDSPRPVPNSPPSAWANSDCWTCPAPSGASAANGSSQISNRSWTWGMFVPRT